MKNEQCFPNMSASIKIILIKTLCRIGHEWGCWLRVSNTLFNKPTLIRPLSFTLNDYIHFHYGMRIDSWAVHHFYFIWECLIRLYKLTVSGHFSMCACSLRYVNIEHISDGFVRGGPRTAAASILATVHSRTAANDQQFDRWLCRVCTLCRIVSLGSNWGSSHAHLDGRQERNIFFNGWSESWTGRLAAAGMIVTTMPM